LRVRTIPTYRVYRLYDGRINVSVMSAGYVHVSCELVAMLPGKLFAMLLASWLLCYLASWLVATQ